MTTYTILLSVCIALFGFSGRASAAYGETCSTDSDCTAADHTTCYIQTGCVKGACTTCATDYVITGGACLKDYGKSCTGNGDCATGTCTTSACACASGHTWDATYRGCYADGKNWGAACGTNDVDNDCHVVSTAGAGGACTGSGNGVCDCDSGYHKGEGYVCRLPYYGESCDGGNSPACQSRGNTGEQTPDCTNSVCSCAVTDEVTTYEGVSFCSTIVSTANKLKTTLQCTAHNECESGRCQACPDTAGAVCVEESNSSSMVKPSLAIFVSMIVALLKF